MSTKYFTLEEVAGQYLPTDLKDPTRWLRRRLNSRELRGTRFGRTWRMSDAQIAFMLRKLSTDAEVPEPSIPKSDPPQPTSLIDGLSARSRARL
jgi:hypothetical protein